MISPAQQKIIYTAFLSGFCLSILIIAIHIYLRPLDSTTVTESVQFLATIVVALVCGVILKNELKRSLLVSVIALSYTYALSLLIVLTQYAHYGLYVLLVALICVALFYVSNLFFNRLKLGEFTKMLIATITFILLFVTCSNLGVYIVRLVIPLQN